MTEVCLQELSNKLNSKVVRETQEKRMSGLWVENEMQEVFSVVVDYHQQRLL